MILDVTRRKAAIGEKTNHWPGPEIDQHDRPESAFAPIDRRVFNSYSWS